MKSLFLDKLNLLSKIHSQLKEDNNHTKYIKIEEILNSCINSSLHNNIIFSLDFAIIEFFNLDIIVSDKTQKLIKKLIHTCNITNTDQIDEQFTNLKTILDVHGVPVISLFLQIRKILLSETQEKIDFMYTQDIEYSLDGVLSECHIPPLLRNGEYKSFMTFMFQYELYYITEDYPKISRKKDIIHNYIDQEVVKSIQKYFPDFSLPEEKSDEINILLPYFAEHVDKIWNSLSEYLFYIPEYVWDNVKKRYDL